MTPISPCSPHRWKRSKRLRRLSTRVIAMATSVDRLRTIDLPFCESRRPASTLPTERSSVLRSARRRPDLANRHIRDPGPAFPEVRRAKCEQSATAGIRSTWLEVRERSPCRSGSAAGAYLSRGIFLSLAHVRPPLSGARQPPGPALAHFTQELFGRYKKRIVLKDAADDDHRMRPYDVNHRASSNVREIVGADHGIVVAAPYIVHTRFELNQIVHVRPAISGPFHMANNAAERKPTVRVAACQLLEKL